MLHTRKPQTEETAADMAARNARRLEIVKRSLGTKYAHHPVNQVRRLDHLATRTLQPGALHFLIASVG